MKQLSRKRALRNVGLSSAIAVTVLASGIGVASAATHASPTVSPPAARSSNDASATPPPPMPPRGPGGIGGDVTSLSSSTITVVGVTGSANTYSINAATIITDLRRGAATMSLALGENVQIVPATSDTSLAASITIVPANLAGRVTAIDGDTISVAGPNGTTASIHVDATTTYSKSGTVASRSDVIVGSFVVADGTFGSSPTVLNAATVGIGTPGPASGPQPSNGYGPGPLAGPFAGGPPNVPPGEGSTARGVPRSQREPE